MKSCKSDNNKRKFRGRGSRLLIRIIFFYDALIKRCMNYSGGSLVLEALLLTT